MINSRSPQCWNYKQGIVINIGLILLGLALQYSVGPIDWSWFASPVNIIFLVCYVVLIVVLYLFRRKVYAVRWSMTYGAAVPSILITGLATLIYGITCNRSTLSSWSFVLCYFWLTTILGLTCLKRWKSPSFLLNHLGLFIAIVAATLGSADMRKLHMTLMQGVPEWRAVDDNSMVHELDFTIQLNRFSIEEYPSTSEIDTTSLSMPQGEPKCYTSNVTVITKSGKTIKDAPIEVNKPLEVEGWKIYQFGYDTGYGRGSIISVFELVRDPWLPFVYLGIFMLLAGALFMFITAGGKKS